MVFFVHSGRTVEETGSEKRVSVPVVLSLVRQRNGITRFITFLILCLLLCPIKPALKVHHRDLAFPLFVIVRVPRFRIREVNFVEKSGGGGGFRYQRVLERRER